jgi:hypothetical protein
MRKFTFFALLAGTVFTCFAGAQGGATGGVVPVGLKDKSESGAVPTSVPSFSRDLVPLFRTNCTMCHQDALPMGALDLLPVVAYNNLVNANSAEMPMKRVVPGKPTRSYLMYKINGGNATVHGKGNGMPLGQPPLSKEDVALVQLWIMQGAKNN